MSASEQKKRRRRKNIEIMHDERTVAAQELFFCENV